MTENAPRDLPLFAYGTLRDAEFLRELFGRTFSMQAARVRDFIVVRTATGYLAATPRTGSIVEGCIVAVDATVYPLADAWEDLTVYDRIAIDADLRDGTTRRCWMYVQPGAQGPAVTDGRASVHPRADVVAEIRRFRAEIDAMRRS